MGCQGKVHTLKSQAHWVQVAALVSSGCDPGQALNVADAANGLLACTRCSLFPGKLAAAYCKNL